MGRIDVAAYIWPSYTGDEPRTRIFWEEGIGEWQTVKNTAPKDNGYFWNRKPLWGYQNEADPGVMEFQIREALNYGVNVFIYDWYWYDGKPVVSIYDLNNFVQSFGGTEETKRAMERLNREAVKTGLPGVHFQFIRWNGKSENLTGVDGEVIETTPELVSQLGFSSLTHYQFVHFANIDRYYREILPDVYKEWDKIDREFAIPYYPHVSIGWDNNPRFRDFRPGIVRNNTPEAFEEALRAAKQFAEKHSLPLVTINSWNEWTETSYLEPDDLNGYGYLEAVRRVFIGKGDLEK